MGGVVAALGNFDGVHLGHQAVLGEAIEVGARKNLKVVAITFDPHPQAVLRPHSGLKLLTTLDQRRETLLRYGVSEMRVVKFDEDLSRKSPEEFVADVLIQHNNVEVVVVGENFRFGYKAFGDVEELERLMSERGGEVRAVRIQSNGSQDEVNSTRIRELVASGEVSQAASLLGRPYSLRGKVVEGERRGRTIGFPTANIAPAPAVVVPGRGVYSGFVSVDGVQHPACTNVGLAPTFGRNENKVEAHLLDFDGDIYGKVVDVSFTSRIRPEKKFSGVEDLKSQIELDVQEARRLTTG